MQFIQLLINGIGVGVLYALAAVGFALIFWTTRVFHVAHGATFIIAAYAYVELYDVSIVLAIVVSLIAAGVFGYVVNLVVYRPIQRSRGSIYTLMVASLGVTIIVTNGLSIAFTSEVKSLNSPITKAVHVGSIRLTATVLLGLVIGAICLAVLNIYLKRSVTGVGIRAMADSAELVGVLGLNRRKLASTAFVVGSVLVVPGAILLTHLQGIQPSFGLNMAILAVVASIAGGVGSLQGAVVGSLIVGVVQSLSTIWINAAWQTAIAYGVLLVLLVVRPSGLLARARAA